MQAAIDAVAPGGTVHVSPATYVEDIVIAKAVTLLGPNAGKAGGDPTRGAEAVLMPFTDDAANGQIIYVAASHVAIDGFLFEGDNPDLDQGYLVGKSPLAAEANTSAAVQNTYFWTTDFAEIDHIRIQNCIIRNVTYDGIYLEVGLGTDNGFNYVLNNRFETMWEGLQTYGVHSVISNNIFLNINRGLSLHGTTTAAPGGFIPVVASNTFTIGEWWPTEIGRVRTAGVWVNYRRGNAAPLEVSGNRVDTPVAAPPGKTIRGFYALNVEGKGSITFRGNVVNGGGNCQEGISVALAGKAGAVSVVGGSFTGISESGVVATTKDLDWGNGDAFVVVSNLSIALSGGVGIRVSQDPSTTNSAGVTLLADSEIRGGTTGVRVVGAKASVIIDAPSTRITGHQVGLEVDSGKALVQGCDLSGNSQAGIRVVNDGIVDAGDCTGGDLTGFGSSVGGNNLSGYGFEGTRWAIDNWGTATVRADRNNFGAGPGDDIARAVSGPVCYSQEPMVVTSPPTLVVRCVGDIPTVTQDYATFRSLGGLASASEIASVAYVDNPLDPPPGNQTVTRIWTVVDLCGQAGQCEQPIQVADTTPPSIVAPSALAVDPDAGECFASAANVNLGSPQAADNCGVAAVSNDAPARLATGPTVVTWTVTDINGLTASAAQVVTVRDAQPPTIITPANIVTPVDHGQAYATVAFTVSAIDCSSFSLVADPPSGSRFPVGVNTVNVTATDTAGNLGRGSFTITVIDHPRVGLTSYSSGTGIAVLSVTGPAGVNCELQATTDFIMWTPLTNAVPPYECADQGGGNLRFYQAVCKP